MTEIILGHNIDKIRVDSYVSAFHRAHDKIQELFGEDSIVIYKWCEENIKGEYEFYEVNFINEESFRCQIGLRFFTDSAALAFKLRWT